MKHRTLLALVPFVFAACGDSNPKQTAVSTAAPEPTIIQAGITEPGGMSSVTPATTSVFSYEDGEAAFRTGDYGEAVRRFESYTAQRPENPWGHYMLGLSSWKAGNLAGAEAALNRAIGLDPTHLKSHLNIARVLLDLDRNHEALERARKAQAIDPASAEALRLVARALHSMGQADSAIQAYRSAILADERDVWALNNLGVLYLDQGEPGLALGPLARAVQLRSTAPVFQNNLGMALERSGHIAASREAFEAALRADSSYSKARVSLDRVLALVADPEDRVNLDDLAQEFRMKVGMWRDNSIVADGEGE